VRLLPHTSTVVVEAVEELQCCVCDLDDAEE
jgi:hypothetical protein